MARVHQENAVSEGLDNDFIAECPRCLSTTVFDRYKYVKYLMGRGWDLRDTDAVLDQIVSFEAHVNAGGVDITGCAVDDAQENLYVLCGDCKDSFNRRRNAGYHEGADSWPRK